MDFLIGFNGFGGREASECVCNYLKLKGENRRTKGGWDVAEPAKAGKYIG